MAADPRFRTSYKSDFHECDVCFEEGPDVCDQHSTLSCSECGQRLFMLPRNDCCRNRCNRCEHCFSERKEGVAICGHTLSRSCNDCDELLVAGMCPLGHSGQECAICHCLLRFGQCIYCSDIVSPDGLEQFFDERRAELGIKRTKLTFPNGESKSVFEADYARVLDTALRTITTFPSELVAVIVDFVFE